MVLALLTAMLLSGFGWIAVHEAGATVQNDAQGRLRSNRDAAVRALVHQTDDFKAAAASVQIINTVKAEQNAGTKPSWPAPQYQNTPPPWRGSNLTQSSGFGTCGCPDPHDGHDATPGGT